MVMRSRGTEVQKIALNSINEAKEFNTVRHSLHKCDNEATRMKKKTVYGR